MIDALDQEVLFAAMAFVLMAYVVDRTGLILEIFGERAALATVVLVATSPGLIRYSVELKQYALDALANGTV